jgi:hypothetical protein
MSLESYIKSDDFRLFTDEPLRQNACRAVEKFLNDYDAVNNSQLHSIPIVIQGGGFTALRDLAENQKKKNTKEKNKKFWEFLYDLIAANPGDDFSLRSFIQQQPRIQGLLKDETKVSDKKEQKQIRKANKELIDKVIEQVLPIYFEHFNCHYFYMNR